MEDTSFFRIGKKYIANGEFMSLSKSFNPKSYKNAERIGVRPFWSYFSQLIREKKISFVALAKKIEISYPGMFHQFTNGSRTPSYQMCMRIAYALEIPPEEIMVEMIKYRMAMEGVVCDSIEIKGLRRE